MLLRIICRSLLKSWNLRLSMAVIPINRLQHRQSLAPIPGQTQISEPGPWLLICAFLPGKTPDACPGLGVCNIANPWLLILEVLIRIIAIPWLLFLIPVLHMPKSFGSVTSCVFKWPFHGFPVRGALFRTIATPWLLILLPS